MLAKKRRPTIPKNNVIKEIVKLKIFLTTTTFYWSLRTFLTSLLVWI